MTTGPQAESGRAFGAGPVEHRYVTDPHLYNLINALGLKLDNVKTLVETHLAREAEKKDRQAVLPSPPAEGGDQRAVPPEKAKAQDEVANEARCRRPKNLSASKAISAAHRRLEALYEQAEKDGAFDSLKDED